ncbi:MAG: NYN domain-containing protein [Planctomycetota bacterium]
MILIIDGYNLIFSDLWGKSVRDNKNSDGDIGSKPTDFLEKARDNLIAQLKSYNTKRRLKIIVIFDGNESIGYQSHQKESPNIEIIFSTKESKADNLIIDIVSYYKEDAAHNKIRVVTSDRLLAQMTKQSGVQIIPVNEFIKELLKTNQIRHHSISAGTKADMASEDEPIEKFIGLRPSEVEGWLKVFDKDKQKTS